MNGDSRATYASVAGVRPSRIEGLASSWRARARAPRLAVPSFGRRCACYTGSMAPGATVYHLEIALSDTDRGVYESLDLRVARHPSETMRFLVARTLAYA